MTGRSSWRKLGCLAALVAALFASAMITIVVALAIWPGEAELTAPLLCAADKPDAFVVADATNVRPGETITNFTLYCVDENGAFDEVGWWRPMLVLWVAHTIVLVMLVALLRRRWVRKRRRRALTDTVPGPMAPSPISG